MPFAFADRGHIDITLKDIGMYRRHDQVGLLLAVLGTVYVSEHLHHVVGVIAPQQLHISRAARISHGRLVLQAFMLHM